MPAAASAAPKAKAPKQLTAYNKYMKKELEKLKKELPDLPHTERFRAAALGWGSARENPNRASAAPAPSKRAAPAAPRKPAVKKARAAPASKR